MTGKIQTRLAVLGALAALVAVLVPAGLASGSHEGDVATGDPSVVLLTLGNQDKVTWTDQTQTISTKRNDCTAVSFASTPELLVVTPDGGVLGEVKDGLGVQSPSDGAGEPCGRVEADDNETISVSLGSDLSDHLMRDIDVDLELKFEAVLTVIFEHGGIEVARIEGWTGMGGADDGPDSKDGDNFRFHSDAIFANPDEGVSATLGGESKFFDEVIFEPTSGAISLEGGADGTEFGSLLEGNNSSQFEIVKTFDGEMTCADTVNISDVDVPEIFGDVTLHSMDVDITADGTDEDEVKDNDFVTEGCLDKPFNEFLDALDGDENGIKNEESIFGFLPELNDTLGRYTVEITVNDQIVESNSDGQITSLAVLWNAEGDVTFPTAGTTGLQQCLTQPPNTDPDDTASYDASAWTGDLGLLPSGETACYYSASVTPVETIGGVTYGTEIWKIFFLADPSLRF